MGSNIIHRYFKRELPEAKILVRVNPIHWTGTELTVSPDGKVEARDLEFDEGIFDDLAIDGFTPAQPLEFNLYWTGLAGE